MTRSVRYLFVLLLCTVSMGARAAVLSGDFSDEMGDSLLVADTLVGDTSQAKLPIWRRGLAGKVLAYFDKAAEEKPLDKFDVSFIGGPFYNKTAGVGIGLVGSALYHLQPDNPSLQRSNASLTAKLTTKGMFSLGIEGHNYLPNDRFRSDYKLEASTFKTEFWGWGFRSCDDDRNEGLYRRNQLQFKGNFLFRLAKGIYVGPCVYYSLYYAVKRDSVADALLADAPSHTHTTAAGLQLSFDTRDNALNASRGVYLNLQQRVAPTWLGNKGLFTTTELELRGYVPTWKGCVLAGELHSLVNCGNGMPWTEMALVGSNDRMRGYYEGRYRDRNIVEGQVELRQHIRGRHGVVAWGGFANVFHDTHTWRLDHTLPNFGVGYRWRFKPGVNVRLDLGFTRKGPGFVFAINEAF